MKRYFFHVSMWVMVAILSTALTKSVSAGSFGGSGLKHGYYYSLGQLPKPKARPNGGKEEPKKEPPAFGVGMISLKNCSNVSDILKLVIKPSEIRLITFEIEGIYDESDAIKAAAVLQAASPPLSFCGEGAQGTIKPDRSLLLQGGAPERNGSHRSRIYIIQPKFHEMPDLVAIAKVLGELRKPILEPRSSLASSGGLASDRTSPGLKSAGGEIQRDDPNPARLKSGARVSEGSKTVPFALKVVLFPEQPLTQENGISAEVALKYQDIVNGIEVDTDNSEIRIKIDHRWKSAKTKLDDITFALKSAGLPVKWLDGGVTDTRTLTYRLARAKPDAKEEPPSTPTKRSRF